MRPLTRDGSRKLANDRLSVFLLARSLDVGGTERQLVELADGLRERGHEVRVGLFYRSGLLADELSRRGVEIIDLRKSSRWDVVAFLARTIFALRRIRPDVIYSFLGGPNVVAALANPFLGETKLVWSVRNTILDLSVGAPVAARTALGLETALARYADAIIANSAAGREFAIGRGFPGSRIFVVRNGIDTERFRRDPTVRREQRRKLSLRDEDIAIGVLGRLNSTKDYPTFLRAAASVAAKVATARFLCVGSGPQLRELEALASELAIRERVMFTGELEPVSALNAFDLACSSSMTEGFSNAIAEAMACGLPCVVTDVGDSAAIVGRFGTVVPAASAATLADAITAQVAKLRSHDPNGPRQRIVEQFSIDAMVDATVSVFRA